MAKFNDKVGYVHPAVETPTGSGVYVEPVVEIEYFGDVTQKILRAENAEKINDDISLQNSISIVADQYANEHYFAIRYVRWEGVRWKVTTVTVQRPRLILTLGSVYNGPTP